MNYSELIQQYFERSVALQWYWTVYVLVIGGIGGFSMFRQRPEIVTTILVTILFAGFAYKNLAAIVATAEERQAVRQAVLEYPASGQSAPDILLTRAKLEPKLPEYDVAGARYFHIACALLTVVFLWTKEWGRRQVDLPPLKGL